MTNLLKGFGSQSFFIGLGVAAASYVLAPQLKQALRPVAVKSAQGALVLADKTREMSNGNSHELNQTGNGQNMNMMFDQFNSVVREFKEEREISNKIMEDLKNTIAGLKDEISSLKNDQPNPEV